MTSTTTAVMELPTYPGVYWLHLLQLVPREDLCNMKNSCSTRRKTVISLNQYSQESTQYSNAVSSLNHQNQLPSTAYMSVPSRRALHPSFGSTCQLTAVDSGSPHGAGDISWGSLTPPSCENLETVRGESDLFGAKAIKSST